MKKKSRLFAVAEYLRGRRTGVTASLLAERFGVTIRTIYRDLDALRDASLPVHADRGRGGGYALDRSYSLPPVNFTAREAAVLLAIGKFAREMRLVPFAETLQGALDKVRSALSSTSRSEMLQHLESIEFIGIPALPAKPEVRRAVEQAWFELRPLAIRYRSSEGAITNEDVKVIGVLMERSFTLISVEAIASKERRQIRLDRIEHAKVLSNLEA